MPTLAVSFGDPAWREAAIGNSPVAVARPVVAQRELFRAAVSAGGRSRRTPRRDRTATSCRLMWLPTRPPSSGLRDVELGDRLAMCGLSELVGEDAVPVRVERQREALVRQDGRRPLDGVDLRHDGGVHQPGDVEQPVVVPVGMRGLQVVADRVVLADEQRVQHRQADPPVADEPGLLDAIGGEGSVPSSRRRSLPSTPLRSRSCVAWSLP